MFVAKRFLNGNKLMQFRREAGTLGYMVTWKHYREKSTVKSSNIFSRTVGHCQGKRKNIHNNTPWKSFSFRFLGRYSHRLYPLRKVSHFSTVIPVGWPYAEQIKKVLYKDRYRAFIEAINLDTRMRLSADEFDRISQEFGFKPEEATTVREKLSELGIILDYVESHKMVIIKPERVIKLWEESTNLNLSFKSKFIHTRKIELEKLREELKPLKNQATIIDNEAERWATLCMRGLFAYAISYSALITYFIFWLLSWDIMEPATYLCGLFNLLVALYFFNTTNAEFTFMSMRDAVKKIRRNKLRKRKKFDEVEYKRILQEINEAESDLHNPEWYILNEVSNEMSGVKLPDPVKFSQERDHFTN